MTLTKNEIKELVKRAQEARKYAYAPYSGFAVGAALMTGDHKIFTGCNIENVSYSGTICAERVAVGKAVSEGYTDFLALCVAGSEKPLYPCGICRQFLTEFCREKDLMILCSSASGSSKEAVQTSLSALYPDSFHAFKKDCCPESER